MNITYMGRLRGALAIAVVGILSSLNSTAADIPPVDGTKRLISALPNSKLTLADGIQQAAKTGAPISAKFEFDDQGKLSLSVYTAEKGLAVGPEANSFLELSGSPEQASWTPEAEIFKDAEHVTRASQQLSLMSTSRYSLLDLINKAQARAPGYAFVIIPGSLRDIPVALVELALDGNVVNLVYNLQSGRLMSGTPPFGNPGD